MIYIPDFIHRTKLFIVKIRLRYERGYSYVKYIQAILTILATLKILNLNMLFLFPLIALCYFVGWFDQFKGIWKLESDWSTTETNPYFERLERKLDKLKKQIDKHGTI